MPARRPSPVGRPDEREASSQRCPDLGRDTKVSWRQKERHGDLGSPVPSAPPQALSQPLSPFPPATLTQSDLPSIVDEDVGSLGRREGLEAVRDTPKSKAADTPWPHDTLTLLTPVSQVPHPPRPPLPLDHLDVPVDLLL